MWGWSPTCQRQGEVGQVPDHVWDPRQIAASRSTVGVFRHFLAQETDQVQCRRPGSAKAPLRKRRVGLASFSAKGLQGSQQLGTVAGHGEGRLFGICGRVTQLRLAHAADVFFLAMLGLDPPTIEVNLEEG